MFVLASIRRLGSFMFGQEAELEGIWQRVDDNFAGCLVIVEPDAQGMRGRITHVPDNMRKRGWEAGDIKWVRIVRRKRAVYLLDDMYKLYDPSRQKLAASGYNSSYLRFVTENEIVVEPRSADQGSGARWKRTRMTGS